MAKILDYEQYLIFLRESKASEPLRLVRKLRGGGGECTRPIFWSWCEALFPNPGPISNSYHFLSVYAYIAYIEQYSTG